MAIVLHHSRARGTAKLVLLGIANHAGDGGAWPSVYTLAKYANVNEKNTRLAIRRLVELGEVRVHLQAGGPRDMEDVHRPNRYDVLVRCPGDCDRTDKHLTARDREHQSALWKTRRTRGSDATPPVDSDPTRGSVATPEPSIQPATTKEGASTTDREAEPMCDICSLDADVCRQRPLSGHTYEPRRTTRGGGHDG